MTPEESLEIFFESELRRESILCSWGEFHKEINVAAILVKSP